MLSYCLKCRKNTGSKNPRVAQKKRGKLMLLSKFAVCCSKKVRFIKEQEASELLKSDSHLPKKFALFASLEFL